MTDEQIAMFRHSEIYSLFRKQQIQDEAGDVEENVVSESLNVDSTPSAAVDTAQDFDIGHSDNNDEEEYLKFLEQERKQMKADRNQIKEEHRTKRRKFSRVTGRKPHDRRPTHRRIARELDDALTSRDFLNYDEENAESLDHLEKLGRDGENNGPRLKVPILETSATIHTETGTTTNDSPKGRKIWWPAVGKTTEIEP